MRSRIFQVGFCNPKNLEVGWAQPLGRNAVKEIGWLIGLDYQEDYKYKGYPKIRLSTALVTPGCHNQI